ncbi:hypothetical protein GCK72_010729 [Caenorhabditis remanei]|uniref:RING-type domain-containing protein n=1 Tax=Caenorhabditis remanei TaxID=31234 RepID=A0A6A5H5J8_CAERE|nr:hypothetical protein GCK72_010729 [Caenorhabditis remanei]KAF1762467.1 hypothetical protein GCK72_010729 [Caenorhabditis remanei]
MLSSITISKLLFLFDSKVVGKSQYRRYIKEDDSEVGMNSEDLTSVKMARCDELVCQICLRNYNEKTKGNSPKILTGCGHTTATCQKISGDVGDEAVIQPDFLVTVSPHPFNIPTVNWEDILKNIPIIPSLVLPTLDPNLLANLPTIRPLVLPTLDSVFWVAVVVEVWALVAAVVFLRRHNLRWDCHETTDLSDSVGIPEDNSDLGWTKTLNIDIVFRHRHHKEMETDFSAYTFPELSLNLKASSSVGDHMAVIGIAPSNSSDQLQTFLAILTIWSWTSSAVIFCHDGTERRYGMADLAIPFPGLCMRPMVDADYLKHNEN